MRFVPTSWLFTLACCATLHARVDLLLVPPAAAVSAQPGVEFTLYLNNPTELPETIHFPDELVAHYAILAGHGQVRIALVNPQDAVRPVPPMSRQTVVLRLAEAIPAAGEFISLRLLNPATNAIMFEAAPGAAPVTPAPAVARESAFPVRPFGPSRNIDVTNDLENMRRHVSAYDPIYFAVGWRDRMNARFQFSFKYRIVERGPPGEPWLGQLARDLYVAYTQTTIWDLEAFSRPFYDSSYKPTAFLLHEFDPDGASPWQFSIQAGGQHESNGRGAGPVFAGSVTPAIPREQASDSRSLNTLYLTPKVRWAGKGGVFIEARAQASAYFKTDENPDIERYRGHVELTLRAGVDRGFQTSAQVRGSFHGHGSLELNLTWPAVETPLLRLFLPPSLGGYAQVQYFNGYGESLLDYNVRRKDQLRFGMTLVR